MQGDADRPLVQVPCSDSTAGFSSFIPTSVVYCLSRDDSDSQEEKMHGSVLMQCAKSFGPFDEVPHSTGQVCTRWTSSCGP